MPSIFHRYTNLLKKYPFRANMATTGIMFGAGDVLAQKLFPPTKDDATATVSVDVAKDTRNDTLSSSKSLVSLTSFIHSAVEASQPLDYLRSLRAVVYGTFFFAPIVVVWQGRLLPKVVNPFVNSLRRKSMNQRTLLYYDTCFRVLVDQLIMPGFIFIPLYNTVMITLAMHDNPIERIKEKLHNGWWKVLRASWMVWPSFHFISLLFIPVHLRVVASNIWSVSWNCFLSFCHNTKGRGKGSGRRLEEFMDIDGVESGEIAMVD